MAGSTELWRRHRGHRSWRAGRGCRRPRDDHRATLRRQRCGGRGRHRWRSHRWRRLFILLVTRAGAASPNHRRAAGPRPVIDLTSDRAADTLGFLLGNGALYALDRALQGHPLEELDHLLVVLAQFAGKLIHTDLRHRSGPPPRGQHRRLKREELVETRVRGRLAAGADETRALPLNMIDERTPEPVAIEMNTTGAGEGPLQATTAGRLLVASASRTQIRGAAKCSRAVASTRRRSDRAMR